MLTYQLSSNLREPVTPPAPHVSQEGRFASLRGKRVVVVEDEAITQMQLRKIFQHEGFNVVGTAVNGRAGVETVLRERPDIVLMDINMPLMDGLEAARRILAEYAVCIVMLTAFSEDEYRDRAQEIGTCGFIVKPIDRDLLLPQVEQAVLSFKAQSKQLRH